MRNSKVKGKKSSRKIKTLSGKKKAVKPPLQNADPLLNLGDEEWDQVGRQEFLGERLYPRDSVVVIDGETGAKKTWLLMSETWRMSHGYSIRGNSFPEKECRVLYFHADLSKEGCKERMLQLGITSELESDKEGRMFCLVHREKLDEVFEKQGGDGEHFCLDMDFGKEAKNGQLPQGAKFRQGFENLLKHHRPDLVVLDPLFGFTSNDSSRGKSGTNLIMYLKTMAQKYHACIVVIANQNKGTARNQRDAISAGAIFNSAVPIRETIFKAPQEGDEYDWSYVERFKDSFTPSSIDHPARYRFRLANSRRNGKQQFKKGTFLRNVNGKMVEETKKFKIQKIIYDFEFDWPESGAKSDSRGAQVTDAIIKVLTENPDGLNCTDTFNRVVEVRPRCSKPTFNHYKDNLVEEGKVVETPTGHKNGKLLRLKKSFK